MMMLSLVAMLVGYVPEEAIQVHGPSLALLFKLNQIRVIL
jgi:hypothetical protein